MKAFKKILIYSILLIPIVGTSEISILSIIPTGESTSCLGQVFYKAEGNGGPYTVELKRSGKGSEILIQEGVNGMDSFSGLCYGSYTLKVYSDKICIQELSIFIPRDDCGIEIQVDDVTDVSFCRDGDCPGGHYCSNDGSIEVTINYNGNYDLEWYSPYGKTIIDEDIYGQPSGKYILKVSDASNPDCFKTLEVYIDICSREIFDESIRECVNETFQDNFHVELTNINPITATNDCDGILQVQIAGLGNSTFYWEDEYGNQYHGNTITGLCEGEYCVIVDPGCGENYQHCIELSPCGQQILDFSIDILNQELEQCDALVEITKEGSIPTGNNIPFRYYFLDIKQPQVISEYSEEEFPINLCSGTYIVSVKDHLGCTYSIGNVTIFNECQVPIMVSAKEDLCPKVNSNFSEEDIVITGGMPPYDVEISAAGSPYADEVKEYTITDAKGCTENFILSNYDLYDRIEASITVENNFTEKYGNKYPAEILVQIHNDFPPFNISVNGYENKTLYSNNAQVSLKIDGEDMYNQPLYLTIINDNGCTFKKLIPYINICKDEDAEETFTFDVEHLTPESDCYSGALHSYRLSNFNTSSFGTNIIRVYRSDSPMIDWENDLVSERLYIGESEIVFDNVPSGYISIMGDGGCAKLYNHRSYNCESGIESGPGCELLSEGYDYWNYPFIEIKQKQKCSDECGIDLFDCSKVEVFYNQSNRTVNLQWSGVVRVTYPDGDQYSLTIVENELVNEQGPDTWEIEHERGGVDSLIIDYLVNGSVICSKTQQIEFYGWGNLNSVLGFDNGFPKDFGGGSTWQSAYFRSFIVGNCEDLGYQGILTSNDDSDYLENWIYEYFIFTPNNSANPCDDGGTLTTFYYNDEGNPKFSNDYIIPPGSSLGQLVPGDNLFNAKGLLCDAPSGYCLFDAFQVYGSRIASQLNGPIIANYCLGEVYDYCEFICRHNYSEECGCPYEPPEISCEGVNCFPGEECRNGSCFPLPVNGQCPEGTILSDRVCKPDPGNGGEGECLPSCPDGWSCYNGNCIESACNYSYNNRGGGDLPPVTLSTGLVAGDTLKVEFNTLRRKDNFFISGPGFQFESGCVGEVGTITERFVLEGSGPITYGFITCEGGSRWNLKISCIFNQNVFNRSSATEEKISPHIPSKALVYPNPVDGIFNIKVNGESDNESTVSITDIYGTVIDQFTIIPTKGQTIRISSLKSHPQGMYFVNILDDSNDKEVIKVVKVK